MAAAAAEQDDEIEHEAVFLNADDEGAHDSEVFHAQLRQHLITHSRGSSINLSFDLSSSSSDAESESPSEVFREQILNNPHHLRMYIKEKLRYHFMSPLEKWRFRRVFPWKLIFQITKIVIVTLQILLFGMDNTQFYREQAATQTALKAFFLKDWDTIRDVYFYPPTDGPYAVYTEAELFDSIDTVVQRYATITDEMIGSFRYDSKNGSLVPPRLCLKYYEVVRIFPFNSTVTINTKMKHKCITIAPLNYSNFSIVAYLNETDIHFDLQRVVLAKLDFGLRTVYRRERTVFDYFVSYRMLTTITYTNKLHDGLVAVDLTINSRPNDANWAEKENRSVELYARQSLNVCVLILCLISLFLCVRSIVRSFLLLRKTDEYFTTHMSVRLSLSDRLEFVDFWLCLIVINDLLVISGTIIKMTLDLQVVSERRFLNASILLGTGLLLVWCGVIRYLGYFRTYNLLILTLKKSTPNLLKFIICAFILFMGYGLCGWVVLGPHHRKFNTISTTMECLYSITNGDDIFATFALASNDYSSSRISPMIWWFTRIYLYSFVVLFICVVINLLYAVIVDAYESIKEISDSNTDTTKSLIQDFIQQRLEKASSANFLLDEVIEGPMSTFEILTFCCPWLRSRRPNYIDDDDVDDTPPTGRRRRQFSRQDAVEQ